MTAPRARVVRPFERLRYLARASGEDAETLLEEAADCLAGFGDDPMGVVIACRRLLAYHPTVTQLWWLCAQLLAAPDPAEGAWAAWREWRQRHDAGPARRRAPLPARAAGRGRSAGRTSSVTDSPSAIDLELLAVRNRYDDSLLSRRLRVSVQSVRVVDETELAVLEPSHLLVAPVATGGGRILVAPGTESLVATARETAP